MSEKNICNLEDLHELVFGIELFARTYGVNVDLKVYDVEYERNTTIKFDIPQQYADYKNPFCNLIIVQMIKE